MILYCMQNPKKGEPGGKVAKTSNTVFSANLVGLVLMAMSLIVIGDAAGKALTKGGVSPFFVAWSRFLIGVALLYPFFRPTRAELCLLYNWKVVLRALLIICAICSLLTALRTEPMANVFGGFFIGPVIAYVISAILLRENITAIRSILIGSGFLGVVLVIKPGFEVSAGMAFAVLAGCLHGSYIVATRWLANSHRSVFLMLSQLIIGSIILVPLGVVDIPHSIETWDVLLIIISAVGSALGNYLLVIASRTAPVQDRV